MNNTKPSITLGLMFVLSLIGGWIAVDLVKAQTNRVNYQSSDIPINDQARYLRGLQTRDSSEWNFTTTENKLADSTYKLSVSDPDIRIIEQDIPEWRNTGEDADYSVLVNIYDFTEEESNR